MGDLSDQVLGALPDQLAEEGAASAAPNAAQSDPWRQIEALTGRVVPDWAKEGCVGSKLVVIPAGRTLYAAGTASKLAMEWGAFEEFDAGWYLRGNQLDPRWYGRSATERVPIYEYEVVIVAATPAVMSKVADQPGAPGRRGPSKFQYFSPAGLGTPRRRRLLGYLRADGSIEPPEKAP